MIGLRPWVGNELYKAAKVRAKRRGFEFSLTVDDVNLLVEKSGGKCAITGIDFDLFKDKEKRSRPWSPSIDRIDCKLGYTINNVRLVASAVNTALSDFGEDVLLRIAKGIIRIRYGKVV